MLLMDSRNRIGGLDNFTSWASQGSNANLDQNHVDRSFVPPVIDKIQELNKNSRPISQERERLSDLQVRILRARQKNIEFKKLLAERILTSSSTYVQSSNELAPFREGAANSNVDEVRLSKIGSTSQIPSLYSYASRAPSNESYSNQAKNVVSSSKVIEVQVPKSLPLSSVVLDAQGPNSYRQQSDRDDKGTLAEHLKTTPVLTHRTTDQIPNPNISTKPHKSTRRNREPPRALQKTAIVQSVAIAPVLQDLVRDMNVILEENVRGMEVFLSTTATNDQTQRMKMERERRKGVREKIDSLLAIHSSKQQLKMPLWRHRMMGVLSPPPEAILKVIYFLYLFCTFFIIVYVSIIFIVWLVRGCISFEGLLGQSVCYMHVLSYSHVANA